MLSKIEQSNWTALSSLTLKVGTLDISTSQTSANIYHLTSRNAQQPWVFITPKVTHSFLSIQHAVNAVLLRQLLWQIRSACHLSQILQAVSPNSVPRYSSDGCTSSKLNKQYLQNVFSWSVPFFLTTLVLIGWLGYILSTEKDDYVWIILYALDTWYILSVNDVYHILLLFGELWIHKMNEWLNK
jgi:hypothetical protein